jgi:hypothetical protein
MIYVRRASGLLQSFDPPELTLEAAADRGWSQAEGGHLLLPPPDHGPWLKTYPTHRYRLGWRDGELLDSLEEAGW